MPESFWERAMVVGAFAIAAAFLLLLGKREFLDSDAPSSDQNVLAAIANAELGAEPADGFSDVAGAERSRDEAAPTRAPAQPRERSVLPTSVRIDRQDCDELRDANNPTRGERQWYIDNCMFVKRKARLAMQAESVTADVVAELQAAGFSLEAPSTSRSAGQEGAMPPADLTANVAVATAAGWIPENAPVMVSVSSSDCTPIWLNGHWVVTCSVTLDGCTVAPCEASLAVCVFPTSPVVVPDLLC